MCVPIQLDSRVPAQPMDCGRTAWRDATAHRDTHRDTERDTETYRVRMRRRAGRECAWRTERDASVSTKLPAETAIARPPCERPFVPSISTSPGVYESPGPSGLPPRVTAIETPGSEVCRDGPFIIAYPASSGTLHLALLSMYCGCPATSVAAQTNATAAHLAAACAICGVLPCAARAPPAMRSPVATTPT